MKHILRFLLLILCICLLAGCVDEATTEALSTVASAGEKAVRTIIESIDWEELKVYADEGYDALTERFPALKGENIKAFLKENGLSLLNKYVESTDAETQENARKLGEILKILYPDLTDEVNAVLPEEEPVS